jgi:transposase
MVIMVKPYSNDLRERVVGAVERGATVRRVAERFGVSVSSVVKWHQRYRSTGSVRPGQMGGNADRPSMRTATSFSNRSSEHRT